MSLMRSGNDRAEANGREPNPPAFTLVEVLVVLVLISILSSMVLTAVRGATQSARIARTRSIIGTIDSVLQELYEDYKYRPLAVEIPDISAEQLIGGQLVLSFEAMPSEAARARLIMLRDLQRMELPDKVRDVWRPTTPRLPTQPVPVYVAADQIAQNPTTGRLRLVRAESGSLNDRTRLPATWFGVGPMPSGQWPSRFSGYLTRTQAANWTRQHQGAECLYLIMASTYINGIAAIESIPPSNIGDTDGDGVPEILDGWGRPLGFIRWPVGFIDPDSDVTSTDEFDPYRADFGNLVNPPGVPAGRARPFSVRPLVISAGPDGEFGIALTTRRGDLVSEDAALSEAQMESEEVSYANQIWPRTVEWMGQEFAGRGGTAPPEYHFPDPFLRRFIAANPTHILPGGPLDPTNTGFARSWRDDNISNYQLEVSE